MCALCTNPNLSVSPSMFSLHTSCRSSILLPMLVLRSVSVSVAVWVLILSDALCPRGSVACEVTRCLYRRGLWVLAPTRPAFYGSASCDEGGFRGALERPIETSGLFCLAVAGRCQSKHKKPGTQPNVRFRNCSVEETESCCRWFLHQNIHREVHCDGTMGGSWTSSMKCVSNPEDWRLIRNVVLRWYLLFDRHLIYNDDDVSRCWQELALPWGKTFQSVSLDHLVLL